MLNHRTRFDNYILEHEPITVKLSSEIDFNSYDGEFSSFKELKSIINNVKFSLYEDDKCIFKSGNGDILDFRISNEVYKIIKKELCLTKQEAIDFSSLCEAFLTTQSGPMPYELLLAQNIINKMFSLSVVEFESMPMRKYEKIQIATSLILKQVEKK